MVLDPREFGRYFREVNKGHEPFPWQERLAAQVCVGEWPDVIDLPTASGKTACIDIALFALACRPGAARRIFFVVDRRVVVSEAWDRADRIARQLQHSLDSTPGSVSGRVARRLRELAGGGDAPPLATCELRGGIYRNESWVRNPLQPMVVASTVDQVGSRLLFRGYGVSENAWPIHAGLVGNDSLILLDEAHCSRVFAETLRSVARYRGADWADEPVPVGFRTVEMTATPSAVGRTIFRIEDEDKEKKYLGKRLFARKPTGLVVSKNRPKELDKLAISLFDEAIGLSKGPEVRRIAVIVNRIATARKVHALLSAGGERVDLMIGRMRPYDRDELLRRLKDLKSGVKRGGGATRFVVATQCLEVGADLDFDGLVTECASMDALQQRFGRLNRLGEFEGESRGVIVIGSGQVDVKQRDPVYGEALARTWEWLNVLDGGTGAVNMGIEAREGEPLTVAQRFAHLPEKEKAALRMESAMGPLLLPAHLDALAQTNPKPAVEPDIALFLHGRREGEPDVQVVWRADLNEGNLKYWADIVSLCPPVSAEAMQVPISAFKRWFDSAAPNETDSDIEGVGGTDAEPDLSIRTPRRALRWRGEKSGDPIRSAQEIRPGDTLVLPASAGGFDELGHKPSDSKADVGDLARLIAKGRLTIRVHEEVWPELKSIAAQPAEDVIPSMLDTGFVAADPHLEKLLDKARGWRPRPKDPEAYPDRDKAFVVTGKGISVCEDAGSDEPSHSGKVELERHLADVTQGVEAYRELLGEKTGEYVWAAEFHDWGKADIRFQALLRGGDMMAARFAPKPLAKSEWIPMGPAERKARRERIGLPDGFRHEMVSLLFAEKGLDGTDREIGRHLIATHHGYARPLPPVVMDTTGEPVSYGGVTLTVEDQRDRAAYRLDSGVAERFWRLTRRYGWWGLAWYEALFRLADWEASSQGGEEKA